MIVVLDAVMDGALAIVGGVSGLQRLEELVPIRHGLALLLFAATADVRVGRTESTSRPLLHTRSHSFAMLHQVP